MSKTYSYSSSTHIYGDIGSHMHVATTYVHQLQYTYMCSQIDNGCTGHRFTFHKYIVLTQFHHMKNMRKHTHTYTHTHTEHKHTHIHTLYFSSACLHSTPLFGEYVNTLCTCLFLYMWPDFGKQTKMSRMK